MFYKDDQEIIIRQCLAVGKETDTRSSKWSYVSEKEKIDLRHCIEQKLDRIIEQGNHLCYYKNEEINFVSEIINRVPMFCNFLTASAYKRVLFVGHHEAGQYWWFVNNKKFTGKRTLEDDFPPERSNLRYFPEMNAMFQFIPIITEHLDYQIGGEYVVPNRSRHVGIMHPLYAEMLLDGGNNFTPWYDHSQYKHGGSFTGVEEQWQAHQIQYDAVVFLGVPAEREFTLQDVRDQFSKYLKPGGHYVDFWYGNEESYSKRFIDAGENQLQAERSLGEVMSVRGAWDKQVRQSGRAAEYDLLRKWIKVYTND